MTCTNLDAGERDDETEDLWRLFDLLNVACGGHAGDDASMARVARCAAEPRPRLGAHPSYPDREHFGRRSLAIAPPDLEASVRAQCARLAAIARVGHVKPHGALYHDAARDPALARAVLAGAVAALGEVTVIGPPDGALVDAAGALGLPYLREGFADRRYLADGRLAPRSEPDALILDPTAAAAQAVRLQGTVDTICVHGDTPGALAIARAVCEAVRG
jgi:UPF0271 protein